jgi:hypothetical protein
MSIQRFETGPRMSQVVVNGNTVYLAGVVANKAKGKSTTEQTQEILSIIDGHLAKAGTDKSKLLSTNIYPRHRRGKACRPGLSGRDHGGRGQVGTQLTGMARLAGNPAAEPFLMRPTLSLSPTALADL